MRKSAELKPAGEAYYDIELLKKFMIRVVADGFVPAIVLKDEFGGDQFTMAIAVLFRQFRVLREVRRAWKDNQEVLGYELSDERHSKSFAKKMPADLHFLLEFGKSTQNRYSDFVLITAKCRWTNLVLGAVPGKVNGQDVNVFEKDTDDAVIIPAYCPRAMAYRALVLIGKEPIISDHIRFASLRIPRPKITIEKHAVVQGKKGLGLKQSEALEIGTEFTLEAYVPTSALSHSDYILMLRKAGKFVRLSPARSSGYGDFEVVSVE